MYVKQWGGGAQTKISSCNFGARRTAKRTLPLLEGLFSHLGYVWPSRWWPPAPGPPGRTEWSRPWRLRLAWWGRAWRRSSPVPPPADGRRSLWLREKRRMQRGRSLPLESLQGWLYFQMIYDGIQVKTNPLFHRWGLTAEEKTLFVSQWMNLPLEVFLFHARIFRITQIKPLFTEKTWLRLKLCYVSIHAIFLIQMCYSGKNIPIYINKTANITMQFFVFNQFSYLRLKTNTFMFFSMLFYHKVTYISFIWSSRASHIIIVKFKPRLPRRV